jgi:O-antigen ligase
VATLLATGSLSNEKPRGSAAAANAFAWTPGAAVLALALPVLFLHVAYQPGVSVGFGPTSATAYLSDFAIWAVALAALATGLGEGFGRLRAGLPVWITAALFLFAIAASVAYGTSRTPGYSWHVHGVTAAKFAEYALLAVSAPLLLRQRGDLTIVLSALTLWSAVATTVGVAQFFGADIFLSGTAGHRQASFLSSLDFTALSGATLLVGVVALVQPGLGLDRRVAWVAVVSGVLGTVVGGSISGVLGIVAAAAAILVVLVVRRELRVRRAAVVAAIAGVVLLGAIAIRGSDLDAFVRFVGASTKEPAQTKVQTYAHRTLLLWFGLEIWKDHPLLGSGFEAATEPGAFEPHLAAAHRRFPDEAPLAFPSRSPQRRYGAQNLYVETLADLGAVGLALLAALFAAGIWISARAALAGESLGALALAWLALLLGLWTAQGFVAGIPLDAVLWLGFGLAAAAAAWRTPRG